MDRQPYPLEPTAGEMRRWVDLSMQRIVDFIESLPDQPAADIDGAAEESKALIEPIPETGVPLEGLLDLLFRRVIPRSFNTAGPGYLAYIPGGGIFAAALADLVADATNRFTGLVAAAPALVQLEANVVRWLAREVGYPAGANGIFTSGGSLANLIAIVTARRERLPEDFLDGTLYVSRQTHHSFAKAAILAGFPERNVREIATDERFRLRLDALEEAVRSDARAGLRPFLVVGNAGTTNTGAVDPLEKLADLARRENLWLHVDGAYGACFCLVPEGREILRGIERADSVVLDPHKGLFLPYGTGALLVRDGQALRRAHASSAAYLPAFQSDPDLVDFCELSPELTKPTRGLRLWLALKLHGAAAFREALQEKLELARWAARELATIPDIRIVAEPQLSLLAFRHEPAGVEASRWNEHNRALLRRINARQRVHLTGTTLDGEFAIRICVLSFRTHRDRVEACVEDLRAALGEA
jgi:aromatic-L-amino-acid decarboxylase